MSDKPRVLFIDDEMDVLEPVTYWLAAKGYEILKQINPVEAIEFIRKDPPDVIFLDLNMPQMHGLDALEEIRKFNQTVPVIIITAAYQDKAKFDRAKGLGISGFFPKQSSLEQFANILEVSLRAYGKPKPDADLEKE